MPFRCTNYNFSFDYRFDVCILLLSQSETSSKCSRSVQRHRFISVQFLSISRFQHEAVLVEAFSLNLFQLFFRFKTNCSVTFIITWRALLSHRKEHVLRWNAKRIDFLVESLIFFSVNLFRFWKNLKITWCVYKSKLLQKLHSRLFRLAKKTTQSNWKLFKVKHFRAIIITRSNLSLWYMHTFALRLYSAVSSDEFSAEFRFSCIAIAFATECSVH